MQTTVPKPSVPIETQPRMVGRHKLLRRTVAGLLIVSGILATAYAGTAVLCAIVLTHPTHVPVTETPAKYGLTFHDVAFESRVDHLKLRGWFIPGVLSNGQLTATRTIIMVPGKDDNRTDPTLGLLELSANFTQRGFAVLSFDLRGHGQSAPAAFSFGQFEQRDVLGAVDFLSSGPLPYPELGRPQAIVGWGISTGGTSLLLAAAQEPRIQAIVTDTAFAEVLPILEREIPYAGQSESEPRIAVLPSALTPGILRTTQLLYGIDYDAIRPLDAATKLAPRPVLFVHGITEPLVPFSDMEKLARAARSAPNAQVEEWLVPGIVEHAQAYHVMGITYLNRVASFFSAALGTSVSPAASVGTQSQGRN
ncbi:MAG TPA: alpha/beta fold hydrolase [Ktedonobacterales bacterium]|nr:alpha/beta fold hydrolase [Ktedonobacterales bacterium]